MHEFLGLLLSFRTKNAHILLIYISPYLAPTGFFGWSPSSENSQPNSLIYCCES